MTGLDIETCCHSIKESIKDKETSKAVDPIVKYFERQDNKDTIKTSCTLSHYLNEVKANNEVLAPTLTSYINSDEEPSLLVDFVDGNVVRRGKAKKESFKAQAEKKVDLYIIKNNEQTNMKLKNNALSGAFVTKGSILNNKTAHNTLTSTIRSVSSLGNSSNEKIIAGNRHYYNLDVTLFNVISITSSLDKEKFNAVMVKYELKYPSVQDVLDCIKYSSDLYWKNDEAFKTISDFVEKLDNVERAGFVYIGDLYHTRIHNDHFVRRLLTRLSERVTDMTITDPEATIRGSDEQIVNFAHQVCLSETRGIGKDYSKMSPEAVNVLAATAVNIRKVVNGYSDFIDAMFLTNNVPASTAFIPNMIRRTVVLSDTDSTMFSVDEYVTWYFGKLIFSDEAFALAASMMFIATQCMAHTLAILSANMNVKRAKLYTLAMKPEFSFPVFAATSVAKHYYTSIMVREGNVFDKLDLEIKGVNLKNSAAPKVLIKAAQDKMNNILTKVMNNEQISIVDELKDLANVERMISESLLSGKIEYFKQSKIKNPEAYSRSPEQSPYVHHMFWNDVFEPKYGHSELPPYGVIKIPTIVHNVTAVNKWLDSIQDKELAARLSNWLAKAKKTSLPTVYLSNMYVQSFGIPDEIKSILAVKRVVLDLTNINRMVLESLGYFPKPNWLISELGY